ncbi:MAG: trigger factor family protein, partial [Clostridia bacterium]|nr:trigger factor family protein [Clostridia bacterium]
MSLKNVEKLEKSMAMLEISVDKETFEAAVQAAYRKNVGKIQIKGFRKGKAPRQMIEKIYGKDVFYEDAIEATYPAALEAAYEEAKLDVVSRP